MHRIKKTLFLPNVKNTWNDYTRTFTLFARLLYLGLEESGSGSYDDRSLVSLVSQLL